MKKCRICGVELVLNSSFPPLDGLCPFCERKLNDTKLKSLLDWITVSNTLLKLALAELDDCAVLREDHARSIGVRHEIRTFLEQKP